MKKGIKSNIEWLSFKATLTYAIFSALWILLSDQLLSFLVNDPKVMTKIQILKGWGFIFISALVIFFLLQREVKKYLNTQSELKSSNTRFRHLFDNITSGVAIYDSPDSGKSFIFKELNNFGLKQAQKENAEVIGHEVRDVFPGVEKLGLFEVFKRVWETGKSEHCPSDLYKDNISEFWVENYISKLPSGELVVIFTDTTALKKSEEILLLTESVFANTVEGIAITDKKGNIQNINQAFCDITGYSKQEVIGKNPKILKSDRHSENFYQSMWEDILEIGHWNGEIWNRRKDGSIFPEWLSISAIRDSKGNITNFVSFFHDISEKKLKEKQLQFLAFHDPLTLLPNRKLFYDRANVSIRNARRLGTKVALLYMDLDNFKNINDSYGHPFGDDFLCMVKERIETICREVDTFARYGGDEFVIILNNIHNSQDVLNFSSRIISLFEKPFTIMNEDIYSSISIGISIFPDNGDDIITLEKNADMALYEAKKDGKKRSFLFKQPLKDKMIRKSLLEKKMREAIIDFNSFSVAYQPKVDIRKKKIHSVEALLRWKIDGTSVSPVEFIPIAEDTNMIIAIGKWMMLKILTDMKAIHDSGFDHVSVSINLSAKQFKDTNIFSDIGQILKDTNYTPSKLYFEITESISMESVQGSIETMKKINEMGIKLSMDDFGTGYSSLSYLKRFPLKELKIDRSFVTGLPADSDDAAITKTIIQMAKSLDFDVVAEGVETKEQLEFLEQHGCQIIQGYYFYKPMPYSEFKNVLENEVIYSE